MAFRHHHEKEISFMATSCPSIRVYGQHRKDGNQKAPILILKIGALRAVPPYIILGLVITGLSASSYLHCIQKKNSRVISLPFSAGLHQPPALFGSVWGNPVSVIACTIVSRIVSLDDVGIVAFPLWSVKPVWQILCKYSILIEHYPI